jgi:membrane protease YdiL (CAAX protease family)
MTEAAVKTHAPSANLARVLPAATVGFTCLSGLLVIGWHQPAGWVALALAVVGAAVQSGSARRHFLLSQAALVLVMLTPVNTNLDPPHILAMSLMLPLAVALPALVSRRLFHDDVIQFPFRRGRRWYRTEVAYVAGTLLVAYLLLPVYFATTGAYHNWTVQLTPGLLLRLFYGTQLLGLWDELFFVNTILSLWRRHLPFWWANVAQATLFTTFLYQLGFRGWAPLLLFVFALSQGYIYKRTASLIYIITIHQTLDLVLYLALINAYYPAAMPIFPT